ncbi:MAG: Ribonuclease HI [Dehalococcoidia bacterium]|nr:Ribonuclease HI [Bacillota bacterium]
MKKIIIYTDGACSGNPGPGGYGAVLRYGEHEKEISGGVLATTNQRMEMQAAISALKQLKEPCQVVLHSDSAYLVNAFNQRWFDQWRRNGWKNSKKAEVANRDLWELLLELAGIHQIAWIKVKGHADDELNNRCDQLARAAIPRLEQK